MTSQPFEHLVPFGFRLLSPDPALAPWVQSYWMFHTDTPLASSTVEVMHPSGGFSLAFNLGDAVGLDNTTLSDTVFLDGSTTHSRRMTLQGKIKLIGVRFQPGGASPFFATPMNELQNETDILSIFRDVSLLELWQRLVDAAMITAQVHCLDDWLLTRLAHNDAQPKVIPHALATIRQQHGQILIPDLVETLGFGQRRLERLFEQHVGMSPKTYAKLVKVREARQALRNLQNKPTTQVAYELGFYDQAHFIRTFKSVSGVTPVEYIKQIDNYCQFQ